MSDRTGRAAAGYPELASFFENTGMLLRSGVSAEEAVTLLRDEYASTGGAMHDALSSMADELHSGQPLAAAMKHSGVFPSYASAMTAVSEYTGRLEDTMFSLASYCRSEDRMSSALKSAARYPLILLIMITAVLTAMLTMVFPAFLGVYESLAGSLSASSHAYIGISLAVCRVLLAVMLIALAAFITGMYMWGRGGRDRVRRFLSRFASFRELFESIDLYRFSTCFEMFLSAGENQDEALSRSMAVAETEGVRERLSRVSGLMAEGKSFSQAAYEEKLYDSVNGRMLIPAERSGMLDEVMLKMTEGLRENAEERAAAIADTAEPLLTGFLMITIGIMLISIMLPLIGIMNSIG